MNGAAAWELILRLSAFVGGVALAMGGSPLWGALLIGIAVFG